MVAGFAVALEMRRLVRQEPGVRFAAGGAGYGSVGDLDIHVPLFARRCSYCDFSIAVRKRIPAREYVDGILAELRLLGSTSPGAVPPRGGGERGPKRDHLALDTLYLGGGTPSLLPAEEITRLITSVF